MKKSQYEKVSLDTTSVQNVKRGKRDSRHYAERGMRLVVLECIVAASKASSSLHVSDTSPSPLPSPNSIPNPNPIPLPLPTHMQIPIFQTSNKLSANTC